MCILFVLHFLFILSFHSLVYCKDEIHHLYVFKLGEHHNYHSLCSFAKPCFKTLCASICGGTGGLYCDLFFLMLNDIYLYLVHSITLPLNFWHFIMCLDDRHVWNCLSTQGCIDVFVIINFRQLTTLISRVCWIWHVKLWQTWSRERHLKR